MSLSKEQISSIIYFWDEKKSIEDHPEYNHALKFEIKKEFPEVDYAINNLRLAVEMVDRCMDILRIEIE